MLFGQMKDANFMCLTMHCPISRWLTVVAPISWIKEELRTHRLQFTAQLLNSLRLCPGTGDFTAHLGFLSRTVTVSEY